MPLKTKITTSETFLFISIKNVYYFFLFFFFETKNYLKSFFFSSFIEKKMLSHEHRKNQKPRAHREL